MSEDAQPVTGRCTKAAKLRRVDVVYRYLLEGLDTSQIIERIGKDHEAWGVKTRAIEAYVHAARQLLLQSGEVERQEEFGAAVAQLRDLYRRCLEDDQKRDALAVRKELNELLGLKAPIEVNLNDARRQLTELLVEEVMREAEDATAGAAEAD